MLVFSVSGVLNIVKLMNEIQPHEFQESLSMQDDNGMTPLHRAVLFDHHELAKYLIQSVSILRPLSLLAPAC